MLRAVTLVALLLASSAALAQEDELEGAVGTFGLTIENDLLGAGTDRNYSHGTKLTYLSPAEQTPGWLRALAAAAPLIEPGDETRVLIELAQQIYTPEDLTASAAPAGQRPYVGWLSATVSALMADDDSVDRIGLMLGVLGPAAGSGTSQRSVHGLLEMQDPQGWESQPGSRPGFALLLDRFWRLVRAQPDDVLQFEVLPHLGAVLGNVKTEGSAGLLLRFGSNLADHPLPETLTAGRGPAGVSWSVFLDLTGRGVGHNKLVEGLEGEGPGAKVLVGDITAGVTVSILGVSATYSRTWRSAEATTQIEGDSFGGLTLNLDF